MIANEPTGCGDEMPVMIFSFVPLVPLPPLPKPVLDWRAVQFEAEGPKGNYLISSSMNRFYALFTPLGGSPQLDLVDNATADDCKAACEMHASQKT